MVIALPSASEVESSIESWSGQYPLLKSLIDQGTHPAKALRYIGLRLCENGVTDTVVRMFMAAAALAPEDAALWNDLGTVLQATGRTDEAIGCIQASLQMNPWRPQTWAFLGLLYDGCSQSLNAEEAFLAALKIDPRHATALRGLGFLYFKQHRLDLAVPRLQSAIVCGESDASIHACLGLALWSTGDFAGAAKAFAEQVRLGPEASAVRNLAQTRMEEALIAGASAHDALRIYRDTAGPHAEDVAKASATAFHQLSGFGHCDAAIRIGRHRLSSAPNDPVQKYLLSALENDAPSRAPEDYLRCYFDEFAPRFDHQLVDVLHYHVPAKLAALLSHRYANVVDLGCGTGLAGPSLRPKSKHLTGVDISPRMLEKARQRGDYDALVESDILDFLRTEPNSFDLIFAADVLVYFGDLSELIAAAARALKPGGRFAFSIETVEAGDYALLRSGRFAQSPAYIERLSEPHFRLAASQATMIRIEANRPAQGALIVLERLGTPLPVEQRAPERRDKHGPAAVAIRSPDQDRALRH